MSTLLYFTTIRLPSVSLYLQARSAQEKEFLQTLLEEQRRSSLEQYQQLKETSEAKYSALEKELLGK